VNKINDGGPAHPMPFFVAATGGETKVTVTADHPPGMSLRDYFAGQALIGITEKMFAVFADRVQEILEGSKKRTSDGKSFNEVCSLMAYAIADAMLKEREKSNG